MKYDSILGTIGQTPEVKLGRLFADLGRDIYLKLERANPGGSIKDRIAVAMIEAAEKSGQLRPGGTIIEPTSGNTGIGLALVEAVKGYPLILVMPESMSVERRRLMAAYGAKFELTPKEKGMKGAIARAEELRNEIDGGYIPMQFDNPANVEVHERTTAQEVLEDFPEGLDAVVGGIGTGGHITALGRVLKPKWPNLKVYAVEPAKSAVLSGGEPGPHRLQGLGAGFVPGNYDASVVDEVVAVDEEDAFEMTRQLARKEGIFVGPSSGAAVAAAAQIARSLPEGATILTFCYDLGDRYLSVEGLF